MSGMSDPKVARDLEASLRAHYEASDPGPAPAAFVGRVGAELAATVDRGATTFAVERVVRRGPIVGVGMGVAAFAFVAVLVIGIAVLGGLSRLPSTTTGATPVPASPDLLSSAPASIIGQPSGFPTDAAAMAFFDADRGLVVGRVGNQAAIWRTADAGGTWTLALLDVSGATSVTIEGSEAWVSAGSWSTRLGPGVFHSADAGVTWTRLAADELDLMSFGDELHGFAVRTQASQRSIAQTADGGHTWTNVVTGVGPCETLHAGDPHPVAMSFVSATHGWVLCEAWTSPGGPEDRGVAETTDGGSTWRWVAHVAGSDDARATTLATPDLPIGFAMRPDGSGLIWCLYGTLLRTEDGGGTWHKVSGAPLTVTSQPWIIASAGTSGPWLGMRPQDDPLVLGRSDDGGRTWSPVAPPLPPARVSPPSLGVSP